jgi:phosphoglycerate-specific signal transduction histidine kinase
MPRATVNERVSVLETKVDNVQEKVEELKSTVKENNTELKTQLSNMYQASCTQHAQLSQDIKSLMTLKDRILIAAALIGPIIAFFAAHIDWGQVLNNVFK